MVLKCPKCGNRSVVLQTYMKKKNFSTKPSTQKGILVCSICDYKEVFVSAV